MEGSVKAGDIITVVPASYGCLCYLLKNPVDFYIGGKITHHGKPVEDAKVKLVSNGNDFWDYVSNNKGQYWLDVGNLPNGEYKLIADYKPVDYGKDLDQEIMLLLVIF